jgi:hypothetical protein
MGITVILFSVYLHVKNCINVGWIASWLRIQSLMLRYCVVVYKRTFKRLQSSVDVTLYTLVKYFQRFISASSSLQHDKPIWETHTPWPESASELYRPSDRRLSAKWLPTFCGYRVPRGQRDESLRQYSRFSRQEPLLFYLVAPQLYSRGWVDPVPDPLLFFSGSAGNRTRASGFVAKNSDH